jgi:superfamily I DNA/RNA helicase/RecB family exonuclease
VTVSESRIGADDWPSAIERTDGHQVVVAGPGTGKTEFLVRRVAQLVASDKAARDEIVVLCFSRRAAGSLRRRVEDLVGTDGPPILTTTFHSLALTIAESVGKGDAPTVLTTPEQIDFVATTLADENPEDWPMPFRGILDSHPFATEVADFLMRCSERLLGPEQLSGLAERRPDWRGIPGLYARYLGRLRAAGRTDYGVLLADAVAALADGTSDLGTRFRYVLVDEYQDTTPAQAEMARHLATRHQNLTVAGDPYQSIYSFRGAELTNIAAFASSDAERIVLTQSFRVPAPIMESALRVVAGADLPGAAGPVTPAPHPGRSEAYVFDQETAEAEWIAEQVERSIVVEGVSPGRIAVLVRTKRELISELSRALDRRRVPHDPPANRLVDHPAVGFVRDLVTAAVHGGSLPTTSAGEAEASDRAMRRVLLGPVVGLSLGSERALVRARRRTWEPWHHVVAEHLPDHAGLITLLSDSTWATAGTGADGFWQAWQTLEGLDRIIANPARRDWRGAWHSFSQTLARQAERDPSMTLHHFFQLTESDDFEAEPMLPAHLPRDRVALTTLHQAKGLEFDVVFIANATEDVFPDLRRGRRMLRPDLLAPERMADPDAQTTFQLQEEVRLAYTAMTRARSRVVWTATAAGGDLGERRPSRFLVAASGLDLDSLGPPGEEERDPVTVTETESVLRRWLLDPDHPASRRLASIELLTRHAGVHWSPLRFAGVSPRGPDRPILPERYRLSPSQAQAYEDCPRRYALERRLRMAGPASGYMVTGSLVHAAIERAEKGVIGTGERHATLEQAMEALEEVFAEEADFGSPTMNRAWMDKCRSAVERLYNNWPGDGVPIEVEETVTAEIGGVEWSGVIDRVERIDGGLRVIDFKSGGNPMSVADAARSIQLAFYTLARSTPEDPVLEAQLWYLGGKGKSVAIRHFDVSSLDDVQTEMESIAGAIASEIWDPRAGSRCKECAFRPSCPAWTDGRGAYVP